MMAVASMEVEEFKENLKDNMIFVERWVECLNSAEDRRFCHQLLDFYEIKEYLSYSQLKYMVGYWRELMDNYGPRGGGL